MDSSILVEPIIICWCKYVKTHVNTIYKWKI